MNSDCKQRITTKPPPRTKYPHPALECLHFFVVVVLSFVGMVVFLAVCCLIFLYFLEWVCLFYEFITALGPERFQKK